MFIRPGVAAGVAAVVVAAVVVGVAPAGAADLPRAAQVSPGVSPSLSSSPRPLQWPQPSLAPDAAVEPPVAESPPRESADATGGGYVSVPPARLVDTRPGGETVDGVGAGGGAVTTTPRTVAVTGRAGVPATGVAAVVLTVTAMSPTADGFVTVYPAGETRPTASSLHVVSGSVTPNLVTVKVGTQGSASFVVSNGSANLQAAVVGYFPTGGSFAALSPGRLMDTRATGVTVDGQGQGGGPLKAGVTRTLPVLGRHGIPTTGVAAVVLNVTARARSGSTAVTAFPTGGSRPTASNLSVQGGEARSNLVIVAPGAGGAVSLHNEGTGRANLLVDVAGWVPTGTSLTTLAPGRLLDTRPGGSTVDGAGRAGGVVGAGETVDVQVTGRHGIPASGVSAVVLNVTGVAPTATTAVTAYAADEARPETANQNLVAGVTRSNLVIAEVSAQGTVRLFNEAGATHLVADVTSFVAAPATSAAGIAGTVTDATGSRDPVAGVEVSVTSVAADVDQSVTTDASGHYEVLGLTPALDYLVCFDPLNATNDGSSPALREECHDDAASPDTATTVSVTAAATTTVDAQLSRDAAVTGRVTDAVGGGPLAGVQVDVSWNGTGEVGESRVVETDPYGRYLVDGLPAGSDYFVCFVPSHRAPAGATTTGNLSQCHGGVSPGEAGTPVTLTAGMTTTVDIALAPGGAIAGVVTDADDAGGPLAGVDVRVLFASGGYGVTTDADGRYRLVGLTPASDYTVCFTPDDTSGSDGTTQYLGECHEDVVPGSPSTPVTVTAGATTTVDASLSRAETQTLTGLVTDDGPGSAPLPGVYVSVRTGLDDGDEGSATTGPDGRYRVEGLPAGLALAVCFRPIGTDGAGSSETGYLAECHENWDEYEQDWPPSMVTMSAGETTIDAGLRHGAAAAGVVTDSVTGTALAGVQLSVGSQWVTTGADGRYRADGLRPSTNASVCFDATSATGGASETPYLDECHDPVTLTADAVTTVDLALDRAPSLTGVLTDAVDGAPLAGVSVHLQLGTQEWSTATGRDGRYRFDGLPVGTDFLVCFWPDDVTGGGSAAGYLRECYDDFADGAGGWTPVTLEVGTTTTADAALTPAAAVTGVVTDPSGAAVANVAVHVNGPSGDSWGYTDAAGRYLAPLLAAGTGYTVCFTGQYAYGGGSSTGYVDECHDDVAPAGTATPVTLTAGTATTIDAVLGLGAAVTGVVTDEGTDPLADVRVTVSGGGSTRETWTDTEGRYQVVGLPSGSDYLVCFDAEYAQDPEGIRGYLSECHDDVAEGAPATPVMLDAAVITTIDAVLGLSP